MININDYLRLMCIIFSFFSSGAYLYHPLAFFLEEIKMDGGLFYCRSSILLLQMKLRALLSFSRLREKVAKGRMK